MSGWLLGGSSSSTTDPLSASNGVMQSFDEILLEATSELLPTPSLNSDSAIDPDIVTAGLSLSDLVRSGTTKPIVAVSAFKRILSTSKNPNVILRTLLLLDVVVKNSGDAFLKEFAGSGSGFKGVKSISEELSDLITLSTNHDVKQTTLRLVQNWAIAFQSKPPLSISELVLTYSRLRTSGQPFPPPSASATSAMIDSLAAPQWIDNSESSLCSRCRDPFTVLNRRHHCRSCGQLFDQKCSSKTIALPHFGINTPVRVCDGCHKKVSSGDKSTKRRNSYDSVSSSTSGNPLFPARSTSLRKSHLSRYSATQKEDEDLQLALRLSLAESSSAPSYSSSAPSQSFRGAMSASEFGPARAVDQSNGYRPGYIAARDSKSQEEEDPDLAAAIAASLRDMENAPSAPPPDSSSEQQQEYEQAIKFLPPTELRPSDMDSLLTFSQTALQPSAPPLHDLSPLYDRAESSRKHLVKSVGDAAGREQVLVEMRDKLREAVRLYEGLLERQMAQPSHAYRSSYDYNQPRQEYGYSDPRFAAISQQPSQIQAPSIQSSYASAYPSVPSYDHGPSQPLHTSQQAHAPPQMYPPVQYQQYSQPYQEPSQSQNQLQYDQQMSQTYHAPPQDQRQAEYQQPVQQEQPQNYPASVQQIYPNSPQAAPTSPYTAPQAAPIQQPQQYQAQQQYAPPQQPQWEKQLNALPHAPQFLPQQFPDVPLHEIPQQEQSKKEELLIDL